MESLMILFEKNLLILKTTNSKNLLTIQKSFNWTMLSLWNLLKNNKDKGIKVNSMIYPEKVNYQLKQRLKRKLIIIWEEWAQRILKKEGIANIQG